MHSSRANVNAFGTVKMSSEPSIVPSRSKIGVRPRRAPLFCVTWTAYDGSPMPSVFTLIINGDLPGHFVWSDEVCVGFLSINPLAAGHTLVVPRTEVDHWLDLPTETSAHLMTVAHHIGKAQQAVWAPERVGMIIAGFEVPHTHVHVFGMNAMGDMDFANAATEVDHTQLAGFATQIRDSLTSNGHQAAAIS